MYDMIWDIKFNYIVSINKKCEFCKCTLIMKLNYYKYINYMIQIYYYAKLIYASIENILINCKNVLI